MKKLFLAFGLLGSGLMLQAQTVSNYVDFESINGHSPTEGAPVDNGYFNSNYHIKFYNLTDDAHPLIGTSTVFDPNDPYGSGNQINTSALPVYALLKDENTSSNGRIAFGNTATSNPNIPNCNNGALTGDYPWDAPASVDVGCWFLTDNDGSVSPNPKPLVVEYDLDFLNCRNASGYLYDLDFTGGTGEAWIIDAYTFNAGTGQVSLEQSILISAPNYTGYSCTGCPSPFTHPNTVYSTATGDGSATYWEFSGLTNPLKYIVMSHRGSITRSVGVAFDYFYFCSTHVVDECDLKPDMNAQTMGCGVQFTDLSTYTGNYPIVGYFWEFGDGSTSTEQNPFHSYGTAGSFIGKLTITGFNGQECCTETIEFEVRTEECLDCKGDVGFNWAADRCDPCVINVDPFVFNNTTPVLGYYWEVIDHGSGVTTVYTGANPPIQLMGTSTVILKAIFQPLPGSDECCVSIVEATVDCGSEGTTREGKFSSKRANNGESNLSESVHDIARSADEGMIKGVYPNPVGDQLMIELDMVEQDFVTVQLVSTNGQIYNLSNNLSTVKGVNQVSFDMSAYPEGLYFLRVQGKNETHTKRVTIKH